MRDSDKPLLVDPDLVLPGEGHELDLDYWSRLAALVEFKDLAVFGPETFELLDAFVSEWWDVACVEVGNAQGNPDVDSLVAELYQIHNLPQDTGSWREVAVDAKTYRPVLQREGNRIVLEHDMNMTHRRRVLTDSKTWTGFGNRAIHEIGPLQLLDFEVGLETGARELLLRWPSYALIRNIATYAFPDLRFCKETWTDMNKIKAQEREYSPMIVACFTTLNDRGLEFWHSTTQTHVREKLAKNKCKLWGVGPENYPTMRDNKCRSKRTFHYGNRFLVMSWHYKFRGQHGRLYFEIDVDEDQVYVGLITSHLPIIPDT